MPQQMAVREQQTMILEQKRRALTHQLIDREAGFVFKLTARNSKTSMVPGKITTQQPQISLPQKVFC